MPAVAQGTDGSAGRYKAREAVALFDDYNDLVAAIEELELAGFDRSQINLMRSCKSAERRLGHPTEDIRELEDEPTVPLGGWVDRYELTEGKAALAAGLAYVGSLVAIGAVVAGGGEHAAIVAAAAAAGGAAGAFGLGLMRLVGRRRAREISEQLSRGGLLLWAETRSREQERRATDILECHSTRDVHLHDLRR
jgi:VIT1/CCC1 family predicted Fe2+/Mn2+ transporter